MYKNYQNNYIYKHLHNYLQMIVEELGELAIGMRLRRLYDLFAQGVIKIYKDHNLNFEPKYFGLFYIINDYRQASVTEIAEELKLTHAGVIHLAKELEKLGYIESVRSPADSRKRMLQLSEKGKEALPDFERVWDNIKRLNQQLFAATTNNLMAAINETEELLLKQSYYQRYNDVFKQSDDLRIITYRPQLARYFKSINIEWINTHFTVEEHDLEQLDHPEESVLKNGGEIFFVEYKSQIVGTCALIKTGEREYELAKMGISPEYRGKKIGNRLMEAVIKEAGELNAKKLWLGSSTKLPAALNLYKKFGFRDVPLQPTPYNRADVRMELLLN